MVNKDMYDRCVAPGCGVKVAIQSKIITDFIRKGVVPQELVYRKK